MPGLFTDDIGSVPLPQGVDKNRMRSIASGIIDGSCSPSDKSYFNRVVSELMAGKLSSGLDRPNYPQVSDMIDSFFTPMELFSEPDEPWVVVKEKAFIPELDAIKDVAKKQFEEKNTPVELRVCVTGPLDLYVRKVSTQVQSDLLLNIAKSVSRFVENSLMNKEYLKTKVVSIDEPSFGLNPNILVEADDLIKAWDIAVEPAKDLDVQVHLHSSVQAEVAYQTKNIQIIGIESAEDPRNLDAINKHDLESYDRFLRLGIARTNISALASEYEQKTGVNVWSDQAKLLEMIDAMENTRTIVGRLKGAWNVFGDRIKYVGPDCGMGLWPSSDSAIKLIGNTVTAVREFKDGK